MAVPAGPTEQRYVGNGVSTIFTVPFLVIQASDLAVYIDGIELSSGYTQSGVGNPTSTVTFATAPALNSQILFTLEVPFERLNDYQENGDFLARTVNNDYDRIWQALKQLLRYSDRSLRLGQFDVDGQGWYRAKGNGIRDLRDPVENQDAVTKRYNELYIARIISAITGPINNAANIFYLGADGLPHVLQDLSGVEGLNLIGYKLNAAGAYLRTAASKLSETISLLDFIPASEHAAIAARTSTFDCSPAIAAATAYAWNLPSGTGRRVIDVPSGRYRHSQTFDFAGAPVSWQGTSPIESTFAYTGNSVAINVGTGDKFMSRIGFDGSLAMSPAKGMIITDCLYTRLTEVHLYDWASNTALTVRGSTYGLRFVDIRLYRNLRHLDTGLFNNVFPTRCYFEGGEFRDGLAAGNLAIYLANAVEIIFDKTIMQGNRQPVTCYVDHSLQATHPGVNFCNHVFEDVYWEENGDGTANSVDLRVYGNQGPCEGVKVIRNGFYQTNAGFPTTQIELLNTDGTVIEDCYGNFGFPHVFIKDGGSNVNQKIDNPKLMGTKQLGKHVAVMRRVAPLTNQAIPTGGTPTRVQFNATTLDPNTSWSTSLHEFTCRASGTYKVTLDATFESSDLNQTFSLYVYKNGVASTDFITISKNVATAESFTLNGWVNAVPGDKISFYCVNNGSTTRNIASNSTASVELSTFQ